MCSIEFFVGTVATAFVLFLTYKLVYRKAYKAYKADLETAEEKLICFEDEFEKLTKVFKRFNKK